MSEEKKQAEQDSPSTDEKSQGATENQAAQEEKIAEMQQNEGQQKQSDEKKNTASVPNYKEQLQNMSDEEVENLFENAKKADLYLETLKRAKADYENYQKRVERDQQSFIQYANQDLLRQILGVMSHFEMALSSAQNIEVAQGFLDGVVLVQKELEKVLSNAGVTAIEAVGKTFSPSFHEAVQQIESKEHPPMTIIQEYEKGYMLHDRLLRPSKVVVSKEVTANKEE
jgi:molecular chaperone GrpE